MKTIITETEKRCGNCSKWMTKQCPNEPENKYKVHPATLPHCNGYPCGKYSISHMYEIVPTKEGGENEA